MTEEMEVATKALKKAMGDRFSCDEAGAGICFYHGNERYSCFEVKREKHDDRPILRYVFDPVPGSTNEPVCITMTEPGHPDAGSIEIQAEIAAIALKQYLNREK